MKLRAKIILTTASLALSCALLAGCGSSSGSTASSAASSEPASTVLSQASSIPLGEDNSTDALNAPFETLLDANPISNQFEIAAMNIEYDFNLPAEDVVSYKGVKSNDNGDAGMVLVVEAADGKAEEVANQLTAYQQDQVAFYGNYAEFAQAQENVENAVTIPWSWSSLPTSALPIWTARWTAHWESKIKLNGAAAGPLRQCSALPPLPKGELTSAASVRGHLQQLFF